MQSGFLSEMSAMPIHGGGVTLRRVLGDDLGKIDWFAELIRYPHEPLPSYGIARYHSYPLWPIEKRLRPFLGCSRSYRIASDPMIRRTFARSVAFKLLKDEPAIHESRALVCPQADISLWVTEELRRKAGLRYISWVMDDHLLNWVAGSWVYPGRFEGLMRRHLENAEHVFVISPSLQQFYKRRFGVDSEVLCGPAAPFAGDFSIKRVSSHVLRLVYFGSLGRWQNDAISLLAPCLKSGQISLDVYTRNAEAMPNVLKEAGAMVMDGISEDQVLACSGAYDAVVLPVSFRPELRNMSFFNVATKFSECLASPVPTLLLGPDDSAMVRIAKEASACFVVDRPDPSLVEETIHQLRDKEVRLEVKKAERELLVEQFSTHIMKGRWFAVRGFLYT
jgi:hypothetical protein